MPATITNPWVSYINRSYLSIKQSIISKLSTNVPEVTDYSEGNILIVIISMFAGLVEQLNYYIDNMAREAFISTARRYSSMVKLVKLIDYRIKAAIPASVDITFKLTATGPSFLTSSYTIPSGTRLSSTNSLQFMTTEDLIVSLNTLAGTENPAIKYGTVGANQISLVSSYDIGTTSGVTPRQRFSLGFKYADNTASIEINSTTWVRKNTFGWSTATDKHFIIEVTEDKEAFVVFGDGIFGEIPPNGYSVLATFYETEGEEGRVGELQVNSIVDTLNLTGTGISSIECYNSNPSINGLGYEDLEKIRNDAPLSLRTLDRAVTRQDYEDVAVQAPGVGKAKVRFDCGKYVYVYIIPRIDIIATNALLNSTKEFIDERRMVTTLVRILPAGKSIIHIKATVAPRFLMNNAQCLTDIQNALLEAYSFTTSSINKNIRTSDIIALIDNLEKVDYLTLNEVWLVPYVRPLNHITPIETIIKPLASINTVNIYKLRYLSGNFRLFKNGVFKQTLSIGIAYGPGPSYPGLLLIPDMEITINPGSYIDNYEWEFYLYPINQNIAVVDYSMPVTDLDELDIIITPQVIPN